MIIKTYAHAHSTVIRLLMTYQKNFLMNVSTYDEIRITLRDTIHSICRDYGFTKTAGKVANMAYKMDRHLILDINLANDLEHLRDYAMDEVQEWKLFPIAAEDVKHYEHEHPFGDKIALRFPLAQKDLTEAGTCYALGRSTACMMHIMRALEAALEVLASSVHGVEIKSKDSMGHILVKLQKLAQNLPSAPDSELERKNKVQKAANHFHDITESVRNRAMHTGEFYSMEEANLTMVNTKYFMAAVADAIQ